MKYNKYLVFIMLLFIFSINRVYAETCYYQITGNNSLEYNSDTGKFKIKESAGEQVRWYEFAKKGEKLKNFDKDFNDNETILAVGTGMTVKAIPSGTCPAEIVYRRFTNSEAVFGFANHTDAFNFAYASKQLSRQRMFGLGEEEHMQVDTISRVTEEEYNNGLIKSIKRNGQKFNTNPNYGGSGVETSNGTMSCSELFDQSVIDLINQILRYPRYIVPGIILALGTLDLFKAVIAGKEDEMKKAQRTFIKRVIIGVCVFLVPVIINAIIWLANIAWQGLGYTTCNL